MKSRRQQRELNRQDHLAKIKNKYQLLGKHIYMSRDYGQKERIFISNKDIKKADSDPLSIYLNKNNCFELKSPHTLDKYISKLKLGEMKVYYIDELQEYTFDEYRAYCMILKLSGISE